MNQIKASDVMAWQNMMMSTKNHQGKKYASTYLKTVHNQLSAMFNHAVKYYELSSNPAAKVGNMGNEKTKDIQFWTQKEYETFIDAMRDKPMSYYAFSLMYWTGVRTGELLALTPKDFNFEKRTLRIDKSYQRLECTDIITEPKTPKSNRIISITDTICEEMQEYIRHQYKMKPKDRLFPVTKNYLTKEMIRGCKETGVKKITLHGIRHSHVSLLIHLGFNALDIASRVGHESIDITYRYAHIFPTKQTEMVNQLEVLQNGSKMQG